ncbi:hypothetical protein C8R43DRAFT_1017203 [Mycena crocata]|nr:hypothetical protein C8R43DRAFT_1017203 [Mycena crocata]
MVISAPAVDLPLELERHIFETCAHIYPASIPTLMVVAWRVKEWVEPLLYNTVIAGRSRGDIYPSLPTESRIQALIDSKPAVFFGRHVRNLMIDDRAGGSAHRILAVCTGIENLWTNCSRWDELASLSLKQLYVQIRPIFHNFYAGHPFFARITHLELLDRAHPHSSADNMGFWTRLSLIPQLTHLSFNDDEFLVICAHLLESCKLLSVLIYFEVDVVVPVPQDLRFVAMACPSHCQDWQMGIYSGGDYWTRAEECIAKRRSGEIDALQFQMDEDESEIIP